jgi:hypothetical protein
MLSAAAHLSPQRLLAALLSNFREQRGQFLMRVSELYLPLAAIAASTAVL